MEQPTVVLTDRATRRIAKILSAEPDIVERLTAERPGMSDRELAYRQLARELVAPPGRPEITRRRRRSCPPGWRMPRRRP